MKVHYFADGEDGLIKIENSLELSSDIEFIQKLGL